MTQTQMWVLGDYLLKQASPVATEASGSSMAGGLLRGGMFGGKGGIPKALMRGAQYSKILTSAFTPKNPMKIPNMQQTIRMLKLKKPNPLMPRAPQ